MSNEVKCLQQSDYIYVAASWNGREKKIHAKVIVYSRSQGCNIDITVLSLNGKGAVKKAVFR